jgi:hypothetical protein
MPNQSPGQTVTSIYVPLRKVTWGLTYSAEWNGTLNPPAWMSDKKFLAGDNSVRCEIMQPEDNDCTSFPDWTTVNP